MRHLQGEAAKGEMSSEEEDDNEVNHVLIQERKTLLRMPWEIKLQWVPRNANFAADAIAAMANLSGEEVGLDVLWEQPSNSILRFCLLM